MGHIAKACTDQLPKEQSQGKEQKEHCVGDPLEQSKYIPSPTDMDSS